MEEATQVVSHLEDDDETDGEEEAGDTLINAHPVAYMRVLAHSELEQIDFPIDNGETILGRGSESNLVIPAKSLSRTHATIVVEDGTHFVQDLGSRNKTYRGTVQLRPRAFYELTNGCELMFANIKCVYYIGELPDNDTNNDGTGNTEQTQSYEFADEEAKAAPAKDEDRPSSEVDEEADGNDIEPTQAYGFGEEADDGDEPMECDPTVSYNVADLDGKSGLDDEESDAESTASAPLLGKQVKEEDGSDSQVKSKLDTNEKPKKKTVCFAAGNSGSVGDNETGHTSSETGQISSDGKEDKDETDSELTQPHDQEEAKDKTETSEDVPSLKRNATSVMDIDLPLDATVAYHMETDEESEHVEESKKEKENEAVKEKEDCVEPTVAYVVDEKQAPDDDDSDKTDIEENNETSHEDNAAGPAKSKSQASQERDKSEEKDDKGDIPAIIVEPTVPYNISEQNKEDTASPEEHTTGDKGSKLLVLAITKTLSAVSAMDCMEQGGGTVLIETYEPETVKTGTTQPPSLGRDTTVVLESYESSSEEEQTVTKDNEPASKRDDQETSEADTLIPGFSAEESSTQGTTSNVKQKTIFGAVASSRGKGKGRRGGRGRKKETATSSTTPSGPPSTTRETTEQLLKIEGSEPSEDEEDPLKRTSTEELLQLTPEEGSSGGTKKSTNLDVKVPKLQLKAASSVLPMDVDTVSVSETISASDSGFGEGLKVTSGGSSTRGRGRGRGKRGRSSRRTLSKPDRKELISGDHDTVNTLDKTLEVSDLLRDEESPDINSCSIGGDKTVEEKDGDEHSSVASSYTPTRGGRRGKKGRGGVASKRGGRVSTPKTASRQTPKLEVTSTPTLRHHRTTPSKTPSMSPSLSPEEKPRIMFTGLIDKAGERTIRELGGELVDSVYQCTHLITDKVRRTVKFLCCLSRGCVIVSDSWLEHCAQSKRFLPAEPFLVKDRAAERQHKFSLSKSHATAKHLKVLSGYKIYLTPNVKPKQDQMSDIIICSGGEALNFSPTISPGENVLIVTCDDDLHMCKGSMDAGVPVHSTELILGGVLRQELDLHSHLMAYPTSTTSHPPTPAGRKRKTKESSLIPSSKRVKK